jgi:small-conductance mechanosensitive channel
LAISAAQIRLKMMTLPGEQFVIRRKAYAMIKRALADRRNG